MEKEYEEVQMKNSQLQMKNKSLKSELEEAEQQIDESEVSMVNLSLLHKKSCHTTHTMNSHDLQARFHVLTRPITCC